LVDVFELCFGSKCVVVEVLEVVVDVIIVIVVKGEKVVIIGFGIFEKVVRAVCIGCNLCIG